ncbi:MAG TPA: fatty acid desaturase [Pirellulales bacterium]|nr:fatty acid desaturase [Pirellulales bacterium]
MPPHFTSRSSLASSVLTTKAKLSSPMSRPATAAGSRVLWTYVAGVGTYHALATLALFPWFFSWTGVCLAVAGLYVFGTLGINLCYHRLLTHRSFDCPKWLEHALSLLGVCCLQDSPARWVIAHRIHHQHSDDQPDPHSPLVNFLWGHMGWLFVENHATKSAGACDRYARDILRDPFYMRLERNLLWLQINMLQAAIFFLAGLGFALLAGDTRAAAVQFGASVLVWGVFVRTVAVWHITWSVNSLTHICGYRSYETGENSRNNWFVALISNGEGWHNNHHADQRSAAHGHRWYEVDITYLTIRALAAVGLARNCIGPNRRLLEGASIDGTAIAGAVIGAPASNRVAAFRGASVGSLSGDVIID